jgi:hypothetical protein
VARTSSVRAYLEVGTKRVFAAGLDWPGWCRSGRDEDVALEALVAFGSLYEAALGSTARGFKPPARASSLNVVERLEGNATTDFGAPAIEAAADRRPVGDTEAKRQIGVLEASWTAFDRVALAAEGLELRKGPRGGGRELDAIVRHVLEADTAYLAQIGDRFSLRGDARATPEHVAELRSTVIQAVWARVHGEPPRKPRRSGTYWTPRYFLRRAAWHALDHAWEIEDRATPVQPRSD